MPARPRPRPLRPPVHGRFGFTGDVVALDRVHDRDHVHAEIELNLVGGQSLQYLFAGGAVAFPVGRWLAYWAAMPHRVLAISQPCTLAWITVPLETFLGWASPELAQRVLAGGIVAEAHGRAGAEAVAREWVAALRQDQEAGADARRIVALEVEALVRRLGQGGTVLPQAARTAPVPAGAGRARRRGAPGQSLPLVERMCAYLAEHYRDDLSIADCARAAGVHSHHAMTLFRRTCGMTIGTYLVRLRLAHAQRRLVTGDDDVLGIALEAGFGSQARFYVAFKRAYGTSPGAFRRAHRTLGPAHGP